MYILMFFYPKYQLVEPSVFTLSIGEYKKKVLPLCVPEVLPRPEDERVPLSQRVLSQSILSFVFVNLSSEHIAEGMDWWTGLRIRSDIDQIRIRIKPLRTNRIRIHAFFKDRIRIQTPLS